MEELSQLSESMVQAAALLADEDVDEGSAKRRTSTFLNVVALGNVVSPLPDPNCSPFWGPSLLHVLALISASTDGSSLELTTLLDL